VCLNLRLQRLGNAWIPKGCWGCDGQNKCCAWRVEAGSSPLRFALLGSKVTVTDLSESQLERDRLAAEHYGLQVAAVHGDMRDLSALETGAFDIVFQRIRSDFVPDARVVFAQVARILRPGGIYFFAIANPFYAGLSEGGLDG